MWLKDTNEVKNKVLYDNCSTNYVIWQSDRKLQEEHNHIDTNVKMNVWKNLQGQNQKWENKKISKNNSYKE